MKVTCPSERSLNTKTWQLKFDVLHQFRNDKLFTSDALPLGTGVCLALSYGPAGCR